MRVLCIEDDEGLLFLMQAALEAADMIVTGVTDGEQGLQLLQEDKYAVAVIDQELPKITGLEVIRRLKSLQNDVLVIMVTGVGNEEIAVEAMRLGASDYLVKDINLGYLKILPSVIRQVIHERELVQAHQATERALQLEKERSKLLTQFIQNASHEFRTPLTIIHTSSDLLGRISEDPKQQTYIHRVQEQADAILNLVDHLVQLARLDNTTSLNFIPIELNALLGTLMERKSNMLADKGLQLKMDLPEPAIHLFAEPDELTDALGEIIDNACRYSNENGVLYIAAQRENSTAIVTVRDTGIGMTDEHILHIFERFYRVDEAHSTPGFGLGLPIAARIIDLHHGKITVVSELGKGTSVVVSLPVMTPS